MGKRQPRREGPLVGHRHEPGGRTGGETRPTSLPQPGPQLLLVGGGEGGQYQQLAGPPEPGQRALGEGQGEGG